MRRRPKLGATVNQEPPKELIALMEAYGDFGAGLSDEFVDSAPWLEDDDPFSAPWYDALRAIDQLDERGRPRFDSR